MFRECQMTRSAVSHKISKLRRRGVPHRQAVAMALRMKRSGRLGPLGGYRRSRSSTRRRSAKYRAANTPPRIGNQNPPLVDQFKKIEAVFHPPDSFTIKVYPKLQIEPETAMRFLPGDSDTLCALANQGIAFTWTVTPGDGFTEILYSINNAAIFIGVKEKLKTMFCSKLTNVTDGPGTLILSEPIEVDE